jgi:DNA-binding transcriptional MerR regulator
MITMQILKPKEAANILNVAVSTLQYWDKIGKLKSFRTCTNRRYYTKEQIDEFKKIYFNVNCDE